MFVVAPRFLLTAQPSYLQGWLTERRVAAVQCVTQRVCLHANGILETSLNHGLDLKWG